MNESKLLFGIQVNHLVHKPVLVLLSVTLGMVVLSLVFRSSHHIKTDMNGNTLTTPRPNVILLSGDELEARQLRAYGHPRDNTPFLTHYFSFGAIFRNAFNNVSKTSGSLPSVLSGKYGTTTHQLNSLHILRGKDSYEHLPGLLRGYGYKSIQAGWPQLADSTDWNMQNGFDVVNGVSISDGFYYVLSSLTKGKLNIEILFLDRVMTRIKKRLNHSFFGPIMVPVNRMESRQGFYQDRDKTDSIIDFIRKNEPPFFIQIHFDTTKFEDHFEQDLRSFDGFSNEIISSLDNNIVVVFSDHGRGYSIDRRLPLMMRFPTPKPIPDLVSNAQNIDIAPTILDYLQIDIPDWMEGRSLFKPRDPYEPTFSVSSSEWKRGLDLVNFPSKVKRGPIDVNMVVCNQNYRMTTRNQSMRIYPVEDYNGLCASEMMPMENRAKMMILAHLQERGYKI